MDAGALATGHYARVVQDSTGTYHLLRGRDPAKDQSYFLFSLTQAQMAQARFPIGELDKDTVRAHARRLGLGVAGKPDSQEICFVPDGDYAAFVEREAPSLTRPGAIVSADGRVLGTHDGVHRFTIGQRKGLRLSSAEPLYVLQISAADAVGVREAFDQFDGTERRSRAHFTGMPGCAPASASSSASAPPSKPADRIIPSLRPKRILRGARLAMNTTLRPMSFSGSP